MPRIGKAEGTKNRLMGEERDGGGCRMTAQGGGFPFGSNESVLQLYRGGLDCLILNIFLYDL